MLTQKALSKLPRPAKGNRLFFDGEVPGFAVRVTQSGAISFVLDYRVHQRQRRYTIGRGTDLSLAQAREEAINLRNDIRNGRDPLEKRISDRTAPTMADLAADYFEFHAAKNRASSQRNARQMLDGIILPKWGRLPVAAITSRDVESLHSSLRATPYRANRVLALLSKMFSLAVAWHKKNPVWRADNPVEDIVRFPEDKRERWLTEDELERLTASLATYPNQDAANAIRLLLLTGARKSEVLTSTWSQFDLSRGIWTKPSAHTKTKRIQHAPLNEAAVELLKEMKTRSNEEEQYLFPGRKKGECLKDLKGDWRQLCHVAHLQDARIHDLRHTYASHLVSRGVPLAVVGKLLGHTQSQTTERYAHLADSPLREATNRFAKLLSGKSA